MGWRLNTSPEAGAIPAAADGILSQLDAQVAGALEELAAQWPPEGANVFSTFGMFSLVYPTRLVLEQAIQRLLIGTVDQLIPLEKNPDSGRPIRPGRTNAPAPGRPYGRLDAWLPNPARSGILEDILREDAAREKARELAGGAGRAQRPRSGRCGFSNASGPSR